MESEITRSSKRSLCVFCGARNGVASAHLEMAKEVGKDIAKADIRLVFGGANCGMMGAIANAALETGGEVTGVFPEHLRTHEVEHQGLTEIFLVGSMHERKKKMFDLSDIFLVLPGGFGTMDEMFEILTWHQIGLHKKPVIIFNHLEYWTPLITMMEHLINEGFASPANRTFYQVVDTREALMEALSGALDKKEKIIL